MDTSNDFRAFIISLLKRGNIKQSHLQQFTTERYIKQFQTAFTHKSFDPNENYELAELIGDSIVNYSVIRYLREWDPNIVSVKYLTRLKHNLTSKKVLATMAESYGFIHHIRMSDELKEKFESMTPNYKHRNDMYMSILEDCFEAFLGTVSIVIDENVGIRGIGTEICYTIVKKFLKEINISLKYEDVFDAKTRFKELCDKRGWVFKSSMKTQEIFNDMGKRLYQTVVIGYPYGSKQKCQDNQATLACEDAPIKIEAENKAAESALDTLKKTHNIYDIPPNPYHTQN